MTLSDEDRADLAAFRAAAKQVREASVIAKGRVIHLTGRRSKAGTMEITASLLESEPFRSLALSLRLIYQANEPAHFGHICNILWRVGDDAVRLRVAEIREKYNATLSTHGPAVALTALGGLADHSPRDVLETWLYHGVFHQDRSRKADFEAFVRLGDRFPFAVQSIVLRLAGRVLDLDDVIADLLSEPRVPRIDPPHGDNGSADA